MICLIRACPRASNIYISGILFSLQAKGNSVIRFCLCVLAIFLLFHFVVAGQPRTDCISIDFNKTKRLFGTRPSKTLFKHSLTRNYSEVASLSRSIYLFHSIVSWHFARHEQKISCICRRSKPAKNVIELNAKFCQFDSLEFYYYLFDQVI